MKSGRKKLLKMSLPPTNLRGIILSAFQNQDVSFEQLVDVLQINRDVSRHPVFQVVFILKRNDKITLNLENIETNPLELKRQFSKFDLTLWAEETPYGLMLEFEYANELFNEKSIEKMAQRFLLLAEGIIRSPLSSIGSLPLLTSDERELMLYTWNNTANEYSINRTLNQLFEDQAVKTPNAIAAVYCKEYISYGLLNSKANQLAHYLYEIGVGPETLVAICVEKSFDLIIGLLGILKAGGAYVPLDQDSPS